jgi:hypothetical protein
MSPTPMKLTLYDPETNEVIKEFTRLFVPWKLFKKALAIAKTMDKKDFGIEDLDDNTVDELAGLVVAVFGNQFTVDQLENGASIGEMFAVIQSIISTVASISGNPTPRGN